jgi:hypothetical protein
MEFVMRNATLSNAYLTEETVRRNLEPATQLLKLIAKNIMPTDFVIMVVITKNVIGMDLIVKKKNRRD